MCGIRRVLIRNYYNTFIIAKDISYYYVSIYFQLGSQ